MTDGVFSMRGDAVPLTEMVALCQGYDNAYEEGIITVVDDSHGVGAYGAHGRGTEEQTGVQADILIGTLGKAFGVNGGYVVAGQTLITYFRETAPFYIYSNPITRRSITPADPITPASSAALQALIAPGKFEVERFASTAGMATQSVDLVVILHRTRGFCYSRQRRRHGAAQHCKGACTHVASRVPRGRDVTR